MTRTFKLANPTSAPLGNNDRRIQPPPMRPAVVATKANAGTQSVHLTPRHAGAVKADQPHLISASRPSEHGRAQSIPAAKDAQVDDTPIARYIELEIEARKCRTLDALRFAMTNSPRQIADFGHCILAEPTVDGSWTVTRASSVVTVDRHSHLIRGLEAWLQRPEHRQLLARAEPRIAHIEQEAQQWGLNPKLFPTPFAFCQPIKDVNGVVLGLQLFLRQSNWRPQQTVLLTSLADVYGHAWAALAPKAEQPLTRLWRHANRKRLGAVVGILLAFAALIPVPLSVLAPAEITPIEPVLVTAPIDGIISEIFAPPGSWVDAGTPIVQFVDVKVRSDVEVARRNMAVAEAKHFKIVQSATLTQKDMHDLSTAKAELDVAKAEFVYANDLLQRSTIRAERAGILLYASKADWIGKPVGTGERLMEIGDPKRAEIRIDLPVSDAIALTKDGAVALFLDGDPLRSIPGTITRTAYRPSLTTDQQLAFRIHARFNDDATRRLGLRGVARVSGQSVSLWFYLFRRPIAAVRQRIGL